MRFLVFFILLTISVSTFALDKLAYICQDKQNGTTWILGNENVRAIFKNGEIDNDLWIESSKLDPVDPNYINYEFRQASKSTIYINGYPLSQLEHKMQINTADQVGKVHYEYEDGGVKTFPIVCSKKMPRL